MAMRITTKMMQNTSLSNLNTNKALQEKLTTQLSTMKKITRPSDDPVIAIRSLKLNASLNKIDQYYEKNSEDAESWLELTESAIKTTNDIITNMRTYVVQASNGDLTADDRKSITENLTNLKTEVYSTGNADSAGRSLFTGYRTDLPLTFNEDKTERYTITEQRTNSILDTTTFVRTGDLESINEGNFTTKSTTEYDVGSYEISRIRLAYANVDFKDDDTVLNLSYDDGNGNFVTPTALQNSQIYYFESGSDEAYQQALDDPDCAVYIAETGELLLGENVKAELSALPIDREIRVTYEKSTWQSGDLDPIHYFYTKRYDETKVNPDGTSPKVLEYNPEKLTDPTSQEAKQIIEYDIGSNQSIRVNTTADEVFTHDIGRDVDEIVAMLDEYASIEETYNTVNAMIKSEKYDGEELETLNKQLDALDKSKTMLKSKVQKRCEALITDFDEHLDQTVLAKTNVGSRESRLLLIQNRLSSQQTNYKELVSENEDADVTELAMQLSSVELTYEAALSSISYVMQTSLLDFI